MVFVLLAAMLTPADPVGVRVTIQRSIEASLPASLTPHAASVLGAEVARLVRWRGDIIKNVHKGDVMAILYEPTDEPELVALEYRGLQINLSAYRFVGPDGIARYWDENGQLIEPTVKNAPLTSYVQITEVVQHGRGKRPHAGVDFKAPAGTPVRLPFAGRVTRVNWSRRVNGNCIEVELSDRRVLHFLHLSKVAPQVKSGAVLEAGTRLGEVGSTGHSNAPHLHYEILDPSGKPLNPLAIHGTGTLQLTEASLASFEGARTAFDKALGAATARVGVAAVAAGAAPICAPASVSTGEPAPGFTAGAPGPLGATR
jgi:murein DD-endopeptidase MepM/ murein hydrolase activator NlpD